MTSVMDAVRTAERAYRRFDVHRDRQEAINEVRRLTEAGVSATTIAAITGVTDRTVIRMRKAKPPQAPKRHRFDLSEDRAAVLDLQADAALELACRLHDEDPQLVWETLELLDRQPLMELCVIALAAMPIDRPKSEIFAWVEGLA